MVADTPGISPPQRSKVTKYNRMRSICGEYSLHFPDPDLYLEFCRAERALHIEFYKKIRAKYGIWAGNQDGFVQRRSDMNEYDSLKMELLAGDEEP